MATRFAVSPTAWNTPSTWDNGAVPLAGDTVYPNGYTVTIDTDISVASLNNNISAVYLPNMAIPPMTSNTQPDGVANANAGNSANAWVAFDQNSATAWASLTVNSGWVSYQFPTQKIIKSYRWVSNVNSYPDNYTFQGSNDGTTWITLDTVTGSGASFLLRNIPSNTTPYFYYRLNCTKVGIISNYLNINSFEMTESSSTSYGSVAGGSFTVPSTLVGTRNIEFSGDGIKLLSSTTCINIASLSGNTVNFKTINGGSFFKGNWLSATSTNGRGVFITGNCAVVFNGDIVGSTLGFYNDGASGNIYINAAATVTINGNVIAATTTSLSYPNYLIQSAVTTSNNAILNINGNIVSGLQITTYALYLNGINTVNLIGNITATQGYAISATTILYLNITGAVSYTNASSITPIVVTAASIINITGAVTAPPNATAINCQTGAVTINVPTGIVTAGTNAVGISAPNSTLVTVGNSPLINTNGLMAVYAPKIRFYTGAQVEWTYQTSTGGVKILRNATGSFGLPSFVDVKIGQTYGPNDELIGACVIPPASAVGVGIPVSAITPVDTAVPIIVGTLQLTGEDLLNAIAVSPNLVAERLRNVSTVQTTGDQVTALS